MNKLLQVIKDWLVECLFAAFENDYEREVEETCPYSKWEEWDRY